MPDNLIRILTPLRPDQLEALRVRREQIGTPVAEQIRRAIDVALEADRKTA